MNAALTSLNQSHLASQNRAGHVFPKRNITTTSCSFLKEAILVSNHGNKHFLYLFWTKRRSLIEHAHLLWRLPWIQTPSKPTITLDLCTPVEINTLTHQR